MRNYLLSLACAVLTAFSAEEIGPLELLSQASAGSQGVFLSDLVAAKSGGPLPAISLLDAPVVGRPQTFTRTQIAELLARKAPDLVCTEWKGADRVRISRSTRTVDEAALKTLLTEALQEQHVKTRGELELRFTRPWNNVVVPDEILAVKILEIPTTGVSANFICRFELQAGNEVAGVYQQPLQARILKEIYVARSTIIRGTALRDADIAVEKRDILMLRDHIAQISFEDPYVEFRENIQAGNPITPRMLRLRTIVKRGKLVDATLQDEAMTISVKAEALEDGVPGQPIRLRNIRSRREFRGKVQDESTVTVIF